MADLLLPFCLIDFDWSITNDLIVSVSSDCTTQIWNANTGQNIRVLKDQFNCPVNACRFQSLNNNLIVVSFPVINVLEIFQVKFTWNSGPPDLIFDCKDNWGCSETKFWTKKSEVEGILRILVICLPCVYVPVQSQQ